MQMDIQPLTLEGTHVRLEPLSNARTSIRIAELWEAANEPDIWHLMPYGPIDSVVRVEWLINELLRRERHGTDLPFVTIDQASNQAMGMTRFMTIDRANRGLEIGGTWLGATHRHTAANTEAKYLMFMHAFEQLGAIRVQMRTDTRNERSQRAIERLGMMREGILRKNMIMPDGYHRSSIFYSVIDDEWPAMKLRLQSLLK